MGNPNGRPTHGESGSPEYIAYYAMRGRCLSPSYHSRERYTLRGITICDRWLNGEGGLSGFLCFLHDMGRKPGCDYTLERIDNDLGYSKGNCRWSTKDEQQINKEGTLKEGGVPLLTIAQESGLHYETVVHRFKRGDRGERLRRPIDRPSTNPKAGCGKRSMSLRSEKR